MDFDKENPQSVFSAFFDEGVYTPLFAHGAENAGYGFVGGQPAYAIVQNGEALSAKDVDIACQTLELAAKTGNPVATFYHSKGAKLEDGLGALAAAAKLNAAVAKISGVVPQLAVVLGVCGASQALAAASADLCIVAKDAEMFLTSPFLAELAGDKVDGAGSAEFVGEAGVASMIAETPEEAIRTAADLIMMFPSNNLSISGEFEFEAPVAQMDLQHYTAYDAIDALVDAGSVREVYGTFGRNIKTAFATIGGRVAGFVATSGPKKTVGKGSAGKAARFVRLCDAFNIPVVTLVNTDGFVKSSSDNMTGGIRAAGRLAATYADATTTKIAVITGKAIGTAYASLCNADVTIMLEGAVLAPVEPSAAVTVLYREEIEASEKSIEAETAARIEQYEKEVASAQAAQQAGLVDMVATTATVRTTVEQALDILASKRERRLPKKHGNMPL